MRCCICGSGYNMCTTTLRKNEGLNMRWKWFWIAPLAIIAIPLFLFVGGEVVMHLWNWLLPPLFGWRTLGFWQALGLLALCRILFGGLGGHGRGGPRGNFRNRRGGRWKNMTPEEREQFRQRMRERCGFGPTASEGAGSTAAGQ